MAEMAIGYGSEFQLMRYLGHHRNYLFGIIAEAIGVKKESIEWLDYPVDEKRLSMDGEMKGIDCFKGMTKFKQIEENWKNFWPTTGNAQNWDGIFTADGIWYFVEAKAHTDEAFQQCGAKADSSIQKIKEAFEATCGDKCKAEKWIKSDCYQLANRLAFLKFCEKNEIEAKLCYISFLNGFKRTPKLNVSSIDEWEDVWKKEYEELGLDEELKGKIMHVYIDCTKG